MEPTEVDYDLLGEIADDNLDRCRTGEATDLEQYVRRHPQLAASIRSLFPTLARLEKLKPVPGEIEPKPSTIDPVNRAKLERLDEYQILREIGRGGMGIVYEAEQMSLGRHVAVKVLSDANAADPRQRERFQHKARSAAKLHHENFVPVHGVGERDGVHYIVMQYIHGLGLGEVLCEVRNTSNEEDENSPELKRQHEEQPTDAEHLSTRGSTTADELADGTEYSEKIAAWLVGDSGRRECDQPSSRASDPRIGKDRLLQSTAAEYWKNIARIGSQVADALEYANNQGVMHRDIKPSNLLLDVQGRVWVTDFGLAKSDSEVENLTRTGDVFGTIRYMAPERLHGGGCFQSDIYSLGLTLYEMCTFRPAHAMADRAALVHSVLHNEITPPKQINSNVPKDLDTIIMKAVAASPAHRYQTPKQLSDDLQRWLNQTPIHARPVGSVERTIRWAQRYPALAFMTISCLLALLIGFGGILWQWRQAVEAREYAENQRVIADQRTAEARSREQAERWERYVSSMAAVSTSYQMNRWGSARRWLDLAPEEHRGWEWDHFYSRLDNSVATFRGPDLPVQDITLSPTEEYVASVAPDGTVCVWDIDARKIFKRLHVDGQPLRVAWTPDGSRLIAVAIHEKESLHIWEMPSGRKVAADPFPTARPYFNLDMRNDGSLFAVGSHANQGIGLFDPYSGSSLGRLKADQAAMTFEFAETGNLLISGHYDGQMIVWDTQSKTQRFSRNCPSRVTAVAISPDHQLFAAGLDYPDNRVLLLREDGSVVQALSGHGNSITDIAFSPDGSLMASSSFDQTIRLWDVPSGSEIDVLQGHIGVVWRIEFTHDGTHLISTGIDGTGVIWDREGRLVTRLSGHSQSVELLDVSATDTVATGSLDHTVRLWDIAALIRHGGPIRGHDSFVYDATFNADGSKIASVSWDHTVRIWDAQSRKQLARLNHDRKRLTSVRFLSELSEVIFISDDDAVHVWDFSTDQLGASLPLATRYVLPGRVDVSADGQLFAFGANASEGGPIYVWNAQTKDLHCELAGHLNAIRDLSFATDRHEIASVSEGMLRIWDLRNSQLIRDIALDEVFQAVDYSSDQSVLAIGNRFGEIRIFETDSWDLQITLNQATEVFDLDFSPDGTRLAVAGRDNSIHIWDWQRGREVAELRGHRNYLRSVQFSPDGTQIVSSSGDGTIRIWDTISPPERDRQRKPPSTQ